MRAGRPPERASLTLLAVGLFLVGTNAFVLGGVLPDVAASLDVSMVALGYTFAVYAVIVAVLSPVLAMLFHARSPVRLFAAGTALAAVGTFISAAAPTFEVFFAGRVVAAVGAAALVPTAFALAPGLAPVERRARAMAFVGLGFSTALAVGAPLGTAVASVTNWRVALASIGVLLVVTCLAALLVLLTPEPQAVGPPTTRRSSVVKDPTIALLLVVRALMSCAFQVVYLYIAFVADGVTDGDGVRLAVLMSAYGLGGLLGGLAGGWMTDLRGSGRTGAGALAFLTVILAVLAGLTSMVFAVVAFTLWGFAVALAGVPQQVRLVEHRPEVASISLAWNSTALYVGLAIAPLLGAALVPHGPRAVVAGGAITALLALVLFVMGLERVRHVFRRG